jgi:hypothetical protein
MPFVLYLVGYLLPIFFELIMVIYLKTMVKTGLFVLKHLLLPLCTMTLAGLMAKDYLNAMDGNEK